MSITAIGARVREDFPILAQKVNGKPLVYLDNAASAQHPTAVINAISDYYNHDHANVHRGVHTLSVRATDKFDKARRTVQSFLGAKDEREIIFTKGCTEAINLVANAWGRANLKKDDIVLLSTMEHHANIVPWQIVCEAVGAHIVPIPIDDEGQIIQQEYERLLSPKVKLVGVVHVSNSLGTINPVKAMIGKAHSVGAKFLCDGAQATAHARINVQDLDADFYTLSGHKVYGPTGIGALYGKRELLEAMPPYQAGGDMIRTVSFEKTTYNDLPNKFEPGTPHIAGAIGLGAAIDYVQDIGIETLSRTEAELTAYATQRLQEVVGLKMIGTAKEKAGILSFTMASAHPHDIGTILDSEGVAIRAGHHCCMPLMKRFGIAATARASLAVYNTQEDIDALVRALHKVNEVFA